MEQTNQSQNLWLLHHRLTYDFEKERDGANLSSLLEPRQTAGQKNYCHHLRCNISAAQGKQEVDHWGNPRRVWSISSPFRCLTLSAKTIIEISNSPDITADLDLPPNSFSEAPQEVKSTSSLFWAWSSRYLPDSNVQGEAIAALTRGFKRDFAYDPSVTAVGTPLAAIFSSCRGACQDFARLACAVLQARGTPARYVIGYALPANKASLVDLHAWFDAWLPGIGWRSYDPVLPKARHLVLAHAPSQAEIPIIAGSSHGDPCRQRLTSEIHLQSWLPAQGQKRDTMEGLRI